MGNKIKVIVNTSTYQESIDDKVTDVINNLVDSLIEVNDLLEFYILKPMSPHGNKVIYHENYKIFSYRYSFPKATQTFYETGIMPSIKKNKFNTLKLFILFISQFLSLLKIAYEIKPDYIYAHWVLPQALISSIVCKIFNIKLLFTTHGAEVLKLNKFKFLNKFLLNFILKNTYKFTANSPLTMSQITYNTNNKYFENKNKVIPMGIKDVFFSRSGNSKRYISNNFLYIGRLIDYKGVDLLIDCMNLLKNDNIEFKLDILGSGIDEKELKEKVKTLNLSQNILFHGFKNLSQKIDFYKKSDVTFIPSLISNDRLEGGPLTLIEAMSQKNICIVSESVGFRNYLNDDNCILFKSGNLESLYKATIQYLEMNENVRKKMGEEAYKTAEFFKFINIARIHNNFLFS